MFEYFMKARYHETDQMGIIHHSHYVKWMEDARVEYLNSIGAGYAQIEKDGIVSPVVSLSVEYKSPVRFDDTAKIEVKISNYTGATLEFDYKFYDLSSGMLCTVAHSKHCFEQDGRVISLRRSHPKYDLAMKDELNKE